MTSARRIGFVDGLRGLAALLVVLTHMREKALLADSFPISSLRIPLPTAALDGGYLGVTMFFFISGFVIFLPFAEHLVDGTALPTWAHFFSRRFWKIVPSYLVVLVVVTLVAPQFVPPGQLVNHFFAHALFLHGFWEETFVSIVGPLWSLAVEVQFYIVFPLICIVVLRNVWVGTGLMIAIALIYRHLPLGVHANYFFESNRLAGYLDVFAAGMITVYQYLKLRRVPHGARFTAASTVLSILGAVAFYVLLTRCGTSGGGPREWVWENENRQSVAASLTVLVLAGLFSATWWQRVFSNPVMAWLALISFNLYLWNKPVLLTVNYVLGPMWRQLPPEALPYASLLLTIEVAAIATYAIERPLLRSGPGLLPKIVRAVQARTTSP